MKTRPPLKQDEIIERIHAGIRSGKLLPGDRLPTRRELAKRYRTTGVTVHRALARLLAAGLLTVHERRGTFVAPYPPSLHHYALAIAVPRDAAEDSLFYAALAGSARRLSVTPSCRISVYYGVDSQTYERAADYERLVEDHAAGALAGVLFASHPYLVADTPLLNDPLLPKVAVMDEQEFPHVHVMHMDRQEFYDKAVGHLAARGRKRIALITSPYEATGADNFRRAMQHNGLPVQLKHVQSVPQDRPHWAENVACMMLDAPPGTCPDGLVISDDNCVDFACSGVARAGRRVPDEVGIVGHCNFPLVGTSPLPVERLGYDSVGLLKAAVEIMACQRRGKAASGVTTIPARFAWELESEGAQPGAQRPGRAGSRAAAGERRAPRSG